MVRFFKRSRHKPEPLVQELITVVGINQVLYTAEDLIGYEYDATIERAAPEVVVLPHTTDEISSVVKICRQYNRPIVPRGSGSGLSGGSVPIKGGVVVSLTRMNKILDINIENRYAVLQPGVINLQLQDRLATEGFTYAPDPSSQRICTLGGNVANNSGGPHTLAHGSTVNHILELEVVLPNGDIARLGSRVLDTPGPDIRGLFAGSEGTLGIITEITAQIIPLPQSLKTMLAVFDTVTSASEAVSSIIRRGVIPVALEMLDQEIIKIVEPRIQAGYPLDAGAVLLIEIEGIPDAVDADSELVKAACEASGASEIRVATSSEEREKLWEGRKAAIGAIGAAYPAFYLLDGVVPRTKLPQVMEDVLAVASSYGFKCANMFHAGDGNLHPTLMFDPQNEGVLDRVLECAGEIMRICVDSGGAITGEHGVGLEKTSYMEWIYSQDDLDAMENIREAFGPADVFNPCKILPNGHGCAVGHAAEINIAMGGNQTSADIYI